MLKRHKWILLIAAVVILIIAAMFCRTMLQNYVSIRGQHLNSYRYSSGGGMNGGYHTETVKRYGDRALISIESAEWHSQDPTVREYLTDAAVLEELEAVVRKYHMNFWHQKEFTNAFVCDGESESYDFDFDDAGIFFSSQIYPMTYGKKLARLDRVVDQYIEAGEKLPGLVNPRCDDEEYYFLPEGELQEYVYSYKDNKLGVRILNGTDEDVAIPEAYRLIRADTGEVLQEGETPYGGIFSQQTSDEMFIGLENRLTAGHYVLTFGDLEIPFEIE